MRSLNYLLTGRPGVGKTTVLCSLAARLTNVSVGGFFTQEIRDGGSRVGFCIETFDGRSGILSHVDHEDGPRVGKYRVNVAELEQIGVAAVEKAA